MSDKFKEEDFNNLNEFVIGRLNSLLEEIDKEFTNQFNKLQDFGIASGGMNLEEASKKLNEIDLKIIKLLGGKMDTIESRADVKKAIEAIQNKVIDKINKLESETKDQGIEIKKDPKKNISTFEDLRKSVTESRTSTAQKRVDEVVNTEISFEDKLENIKNMYNIVDAYVRNDEFWNTDGTPKYANVSEIADEYKKNRTSQKLVDEKVFKDLESANNKSNFYREIQILEAMIDDDKKDLDDINKFYNTLKKNLTLIGDKELLGKIKIGSTSSTILDDVKIDDTNKSEVKKAMEELRNEYANQYNKALKKKNDKRAKRNYGYKDLFNDKIATEKSRIEAENGKNAEDFLEKNAFLKLFPDLKELKTNDKNEVKGQVQVTLEDNEMIIQQINKFHGKGDAVVLRNLLKNRMNQINKMVDAKDYIDGDSPENKQKIDSTKPLTDEQKADLKLEDEIVYNEDDKKYELTDEQKSKIEDKLKDKLKDVENLKEESIKIGSDTVELKHSEISLEKLGINDKYEYKHKENGVDRFYDLANLGADIGEDREIKLTEEEEKLSKREKDELIKKKKEERDKKIEERKQAKGRIKDNIVQEIFDEISADEGKYKKALQAIGEDNKLIPADNKGLKHFFGNVWRRVRRKETFEQEAKNKVDEKLKDEIRKLVDARVETLKDINENNKNKRGNERERDLMIKNEYERIKSENQAKIDAYNRSIEEQDEKVNSDENQAKKASWELSKDETEKIRAAQIREIANFYKDKNKKTEEFDFSKVKDTADDEFYKRLDEGEERD